MASAPPPPTYSDEYLAADKGPQVLASIITVATLSTVFVAARMFVRGYIKKNVQTDDYLIILSTLFAWACVGLSIEAVRWGNGKHFDLLDLEEKQAAVKYTIFGFPPGIMSFSLPKIAVVSLLTRLLNPSRWHRIFLWALAGVCQVALLGCIVILFAQCRPSASQWDFSLAPQAKCWDKWILVYYSIFAGSFSAVTDLYLAVYPTVVLFNLRIELKKKIALCFALGIGSVSTAVATYKTTRIPSLTSDDFSYDTSDLVIWTIVEGSTLIIASCIPILQPLIDLVVGRTTLRSKPSGYKAYGSSGHGTSGTGGLRSGDLEMNGGWRRFGRPRDPDEDLLRTNIDRDNEGKESSQESILAPVAEEASQLQESHAQPPPSDNSGRTAGLNAADAGLASTTDLLAAPTAQQDAHGIVQTREIRVEYGEGPPPNRWGALQY